MTRSEGTTQVVILLIMGVMATAASFKQVHNLAVRHPPPVTGKTANVVDVAAVPVRVGTGADPSWSIASLVPIGDDQREPVVGGASRAFLA
jgi:F0F1-type ATP synthase alpha subunit